MLGFARDGMRRIVLAVSTEWSDYYYLLRTGGKKVFFPFTGGPSAYCAHIKREILCSFHPIDIFNNFFPTLSCFFISYFHLFVPPGKFYDVWMT